MQPHTTSVLRTKDQHIDLMEAAVLMPLNLGLNSSLGPCSSNGVRSMKTIAQHFQRVADGEESKGQANQEIADHLLAFAGQVSADTNESAHL